MARNFSGSDFGSASSSYRDQEDADPRVGLVNLADIMLVFACGLMLALVVRWSIDLPTVDQLDESQMQEVDDVQELVDEIQAEGGSYLELGTVYQDPTTGRLYVLTQDDDASDDAADDAISVPETSSDNISAESSTEQEATE